MTQQIGPRVIEIVAEQALLMPEDVTPETSLEELGLDSLAVVEIVFRLEEAFDITVPFNANDPAASGFALARVGQIIDGVNRLVAARG